MTGYIPTSQELFASTHFINGETLCTRRYRRSSVSCSLACAGVTGGDVPVLNIDSICPPQAASILGATSISMEKPSTAKRHADLVEHLLAVSPLCSPFSAELPRFPNYLQSSVLHFPYVSDHHLQPWRSTPDVVQLHFVVFGDGRVLWWDRSTRHRGFGRASVKETK